MPKRKSHLQASSLSQGSSQSSNSSSSASSRSPEEENDTQLSFTSSQHSRDNKKKKPKFKRQFRKIIVPGQAIAPGSSLPSSSSNKKRTPKSSNRIQRSTVASSRNQRSIDRTKPTPRNASVSSKKRKNSGTNRPQRKTLSPVIDVDLSSSSSDSSVSSGNKTMAAAAPDPHDSDSELEVPYTQNLVGVTSNAIAALGLLSSTKSISNEPLRPGDVICYTCPISVAGSRDSRRVSQVLNTDPNRDIPLVLDNGEYLPTDTYVRRIKEYKNGALLDHPGIARPIEHFLLKKRALSAAVSGNLAGLQAQVERIRQIMTSAKYEMERIPQNLTKKTSSDEEEEDDDEDEEALSYKKRKMALAKSRRISASTITNDPTMPQLNTSDEESINSSLLPKPTASKKRKTPKNKSDDGPADSSSSSSNSDDNVAPPESRKKAAFRKQTRTIDDSEDDDACLVVDPPTKQKHSRRRDTTTTTSSSNRARTTAAKKKPSFGLGLSKRNHHRTPHVSSSVDKGGKTTTSRTPASNKTPNQNGWIMSRHSKSSSGSSKKGRTSTGSSPRDPLDLCSSDDDDIPASRIRTGVSKKKKPEKQGFKSVLCRTPDMSKPELLVKPSNLSKSSSSGYSRATHASSAATSDQPKPKPSVFRPERLDEEMEFCIDSSGDEANGNENYHRNLLKQKPGRHYDASPSISSTFTSQSSQEAPTKKTPRTTTSKRSSHSTTTGMKLHLEANPRYGSRLDD